MLLLQRTAFRLACNHGSGQALEQLLHRWSVSGIGILRLQPTIANWICRSLANRTSARVMFSTY